MADTQRKRRKILAIDDDPQMRDVIEMALKKDYDVKMAQTGEEGIEVAKREVPDLILCDVMMPGMTGSEVLRHLQRDPALFYIPVVMMTAAALDPVTISMFQQHPNCKQWMRKPFGMDLLLKTVSEAMASRITAPRPDTGSKKRQYKIMIVEDEVAFFEFLSLSAHPDDILLRAPDGQSALDQIEKFKPDLILADIRLPRLSGDKLVQLLNQNSKYKNIPVVLMTAFPVEPTLKASLIKTCSNLKVFLQKPFNDTTLRKTIDGILVRDLVS